MHKELNDFSQGVVDRFSFVEKVDDQDLPFTAHDLTSEVLMSHLNGGYGDLVVEHGFSLLYDGHQYYLSRILEDGSGVELESEYSSQHRRSTSQQVEQVNQLTQTNRAIEEEIQHCDQLLCQLTTALKNSKKALTSMDLNSDELDIHEVGVMVIEQKRIGEEIRIQQAKVKELSSQLQCLDPNQLRTFRHRNVMILPFGISRLSKGELIQLLRLSEIDYSRKNLCCYRESVEITAELKD